MIPVIRAQQPYFSSLHYLYKGLAWKNENQYYFMIRYKITLSLHAPTWSWSGWSLGPADIPRKQLKMFSTQSWFVLQVRRMPCPHSFKSSCSALKARIWHKIPRMKGNGFRFSLKTMFLMKNCIFSSASCCWASKTPNAERRPSRMHRELEVSNHCNKYKMLRQKLTLKTKNTKYAHERKKNF